MGNINQVVSHMGNCKMLTNSKLQGAVWPCYFACVLSVIHTAVIGIAGSLLNCSEVDFYFFRLY